MSCNYKAFLQSINIRREICAFGYLEARARFTGKSSEWISVAGLSVFISNRVACVKQNSLTIERILFQRERMIFIHVTTVLQLGPTGWRSVTLICGALEEHLLAYLLTCVTVRSTWWRRLASVDKAHVL